MFPAKNITKFPTRQEDLTLKPTFRLGEDGIAEENRIPNDNYLTGAEEQRATAAVGCWQLQIGTAAVSCWQLQIGCEGGRLRRAGLTEMTDHAAWVSAGAGGAPLAGDASLARGDSVRPSSVGGGGHGPHGYGLVSHRSDRTTWGS